MTRSYAILTRPPLTLLPVRLACVKHAASVRSEPGSNSQVHQRDQAEASSRGRLIDQAPLTTLDVKARYQPTPPADPAHGTTGSTLSAYLLPKDRCDCQRSEPLGPAG